MLGCDTPGVATLTIWVGALVVDDGVKVEKFKGLAVKDDLFTSILPANKPT